MESFIVASQFCFDVVASSFHLIVTVCCTWHDVRNHNASHSKCLSVCLSDCLCTVVIRAAFRYAIASNLSAAVAAMANCPIMCLAGVRRSSWCTMHTAHTHVNNLCLSVLYALSINSFCFSQFTHESLKTVIAHALDEKRFRSRGE